jgi:hypothetical protein
MSKPNPRPVPLSTPKRAAVLAAAIIGVLSLSPAAPAGAQSAGLSILGAMAPGAAGPRVVVTLAYECDTDTQTLVVAVNLPSGRNLGTVRTTPECTGSPGTHDIIVRSRNGHFRSGQLVEIKADLQDPSNNTVHVEAERTLQLP